MSTLNIKLDRIICADWNRHAASGLFPPLLAKRIPGTPVIPEIRPWYERSSGLWVTGRLDACLRTADGLHAPVDHKGRGYPPYGTHEAYLLQLDVYDLLLQGNGYATAGYGILIYYIPEAGELTGLPMTVEVQQVATDAGRALLWVAKAREVLDMQEPPSASAGCAFCRWAAETGRAA